MKSLKFVIVLFCIFTLFSLNALSDRKADLVVVRKSKHKLYLIKSGKVIKTFSIALGKHPRGAKHKMGDCRTPEGVYVLDYKNAHSKFYKSIHISYPNAQDKKYALKRGFSAGGDIMIHGQKNGLGFFSFITQNFDWTRGCIAVSNKNMDEIWRLVKVGTVIEIYP